MKRRRHRGAEAERERSEGPRNAAMDLCGCAACEAF